MDTTRTEDPAETYDRALALAEKGNLEDALKDRLDLSKEMVRKKNDATPIQPYTADRPTQIVVDNDTSSFFTIVEVVTFDFPGLLFRVTDATRYREIRKSSFRAVCVFPAFHR